MTGILKNQIALITGASRGIGRAIAQLLAQEGMHLALVARTEPALHEIERECRAYGVKVITLACNLEQSDRWKWLVEQTYLRLGGLHALINNAGVFLDKGSADTSVVSDWEMTLTINLSAVMGLCRYALPYLEQHESGAIINIASILGKQSSSNSAAYCASKHGVLGFSGALFEDVREKKIKVCTICPGLVRTDMVEENPNRDRSKMIQPEDIAETVRFVLTFPKTSCPTEIVIRPQQTPYR